MERHLIERRPTWWLLYVIAAALVALVGLVEASVSSAGARMTLDLVVLVVMSALMLGWVRANRARIELAEAAETRRAPVDVVPPAPRSLGPRLEPARAGHRPLSSRRDLSRVPAETPGRRG